MLPDIVATTVVRNHSTHILLTAEQYRVRRNLYDNLVIRSGLRDYNHPYKPPTNTWGSLTMPDVV